MSRKLLLEHINVPGINTFDVYRQNGGYRSVEKALKTMAPLKPFITLLDNVKFPDTYNLLFTPPARIVL